MQTDLIVLCCQRKLKHTGAPFGFAQGRLPVHRLRAVAKDAKQIAESVAALREKVWIENRELVGTAAGALRFVFRLRDHTVKRSRRHIVAVDHADAAQREAGIRSTLPCAAAIAALEHNAGLAAGREQPLMAAVIGSRT